MNKNILVIIVGLICTIAASHCSSSTTSSSADGSLRKRGGVLISQQSSTNLSAIASIAKKKAEKKARLKRSVDPYETDEDETDEVQEYSIVLMGSVSGAKTKKINRLRIISKIVTRSKGPEDLLLLLRRAAVEIASPVKR